MNTPLTPQNNLRKYSGGKLHYALLRFLALVAVLLVLPVVQAAVTLPFYDGFNYTEGTTLGSANGGIANWTIGNSVGGGTPTNRAAAALSYSGLPASTGLGVQLGYIGANKERGVDTGPLDMTNTVTLYASFLLNVQTLPSSNCPVAYFDDNAGASSSIQGVGLLPDGRLTLSRNAAVTSPGGTSSVALGVGTNYLIVFRYKFNTGSANDELKLWVNPSLGQPSETAADLTIATGGSDRPYLQGFFIKQDSSVSGILYFDELRIGTNWTDVTPSAICSPAGFATAPVNATNSVGATASFSCIATGSVPSLQWQVSTDGGGSFNNVSTGTGGTTTNYTSAALAGSDNGNQYRCIATVSCDSSSATSAVAVVTVVDITGKFFRSATNGNWNSAATWEVSPNGSSWSAALAPPSSLSSNIVVRSPHTVTVTANVTVDQVTVNSGGKLSVAGGNLTVADVAADAFDLDVAGTLEVSAGSGTNDFGTAGIRFQNGGVFDWSRAAAPIIPTATWQDGSTCRISATSTAGDVFATGVSGQSYYDLVFDTTAGGQSRRCRLGINGTNTIVRRDFSITIPDTASASVSINNETNGILTVGRHVTFVTGASVNSTKVLFNNVAAASYLFRVGGNFSASGFLDGFGSSSTLVEFYGGGSHSLSLPTGANLITRSAMNWVVDSGSTLSLASQIDGFNSFTNQGTLTFGANLITGGTTLVFDTGGLVNANGTNAIATGLNTFTAGGTLNLGALPTFVGGETFQVIGATNTYGGTFSSLLPTTPGVGFTWGTSNFDATTTLAVVGSGGGPATSPTNLVSTVGGGNLTLTWPGDHTGWTLQTQTNSRSIGLAPATNAWFDVAGSTATNQVVMPISPTVPTVFYRLRLVIP